MAEVTSGYKNVTATRDTAGNVADTLRFEWSQTGQSVAGNYTDIKWSLKLVSGAYGAISSSTSKPWKVTVDGKAFSGNTTVGIGNNTSKTLASGTKRIEHGADGKKRFSVSFSQTFNITFNQYVGTISGSASWDLKTIPRATAPSLNPSSVEMGGSIAISLPRATTEFTHTLQHDFYAGSWTTFATGAGTEATLTVPEDWAARIPNAENGTGRIRCLTYNGEILIGEKIVSFTAVVPDTVVPVISGITVSEAVTEIKTQFGAFIQSHSKLLIKTIASGASGSTIKSGSIVVLGKTYAGIQATTEEVMTSGTVKIVAKVTDSRGRTASREMTISVLPYTNPTINAFKVYRVESDGTASNTGASLKYEYSFSISACGDKNTKAYRVEYQVEGASAWTVLTSGAAYSLNTSGRKDAVLTQENAYRVRLVIADFFKEASYELPIESAVYPIVFTPGLDGVGFCGFPRGKDVWIMGNAYLAKQLIALDANADGSDMDIVAEIKAIKSKIGM